jgi:hypothetical protein
MFIVKFVSNESIVYNKITKLTNILNLADFYKSKHIFIINSSSLNIITENDEQEIFKISDYDIFFVNKYKTYNDEIKICNEIPILFFKCLAISCINKKIIPFNNEILYFNNDDIAIKSNNIFNCKNVDSIYLLIHDKKYYKQIYDNTLDYDTIKSRPIVVYKTSLPFNSTDLKIKIDYNLLLLYNTICNMLYNNINL